MKNNQIKKIVGRRVLLSIIVMVLFSVFALYAKTLKFAHVYEESHPLHKAALMAAEQVKKETKNAVEIKVFPASSLGKEAGLNEGLQFGTVDIIYTGAGFVGAFYGPISISDYPFTLRNLDHWKGYINSDLFKELSRGYSKAVGGSKIMAVSYYGSRHITANKPILTPNDMRGLKIRVPNAPAYVLFPKAVGANPTPMAFAEVYLALQQKVVDAQENPLPTIKAKRFYEVQSDISLTGHIINSTLTVVSGVTLKKLNSKQRRILQEALRDAAEWTTKEITKSENDLVDWFKKKGIKVHKVNRMPFIKKVAPALVTGDLPFSKETYNRLQAIPDAR